ncbi:hypothetical protein NQ317_012262 [Molorchus minor]|uniref:Uncharacterized protein n=1 Tax=Molorchus minor TaxID=1323400 RepID=A0ABQ9K380_9CUCU|nr:hypothetical protein NQ317_012262 [Molorchus minor]
MSKRLKTPQPYNPPWSQQNLPSHLTQNMHLSELSIAGQLQHNPFFGSLQTPPKYMPNIADAHPYYGLPDVILLQNYGVIPQANYNLIPDSLELQRRLNRNSLIEHEMKRRFNSMLNLTEESLSDKVAQRKYGRT